MNTAQNILRSYLHVRDGGEADVLPDSETFWQELAGGAYPQLDQGRLFSAFTFSESWSTWERHPAGDEIVMLLSGSATLVLEESGLERSTTLARPGDYVLVPKGVWHTARTDAPCTLLFLTPGSGTEHRPVDA